MVSCPVMFDGGVLRGIIWVTNSISCEDSAKYRSVIGARGYKDAFYLSILRSIPEGYDFCLLYLPFTTASLQTLYTTAQHITPLGYANGRTR